MKTIRPILGIALFILISLCTTVTKAESAFERPDSLNRVRIQQASTGVELRQNFPNPFNQSTRIVFTVPNEQNVELKVYDILGQVVFQRNIYADRGINTFSFDRENLRAGIYFYSLQIGSTVITKRMNIRD